MMLFHNRRNEKNNVIHLSSSFRRSRMSQRERNVNEGEFNSRKFGLDTHFRLRQQSCNKQFSLTQHHLHQQLITFHTLCSLQARLTIGYERHFRNEIFRNHNFVESNFGYTPSAFSILPCPKLMVTVMDLIVCFIASVLLIFLYCYCPC